MTISNDVGSDTSDGTGVNETDVSDAVSANAPDGRATRASGVSDSVCEGRRDPLHDWSQSSPPPDGALAGPPQQPQPMLPGLEGC